MTNIFICLLKKAHFEVRNEGILYNIVLISENIGEENSVFKVDSRLSLKERIFVYSRENFTFKRNFKID